MLQGFVEEKDSKNAALKRKLDEVQEECEATIQETKKLHLCIVFYLRSQWRETVKRAVQNWKVHQKEATIAALEDECEMRAQLRNAEEQLKYQQQTHALANAVQVQRNVRGAQQRDAVKMWERNAKDALLEKKDAANAALKDALLRERALNFYALQEAQEKCETAEEQLAALRQDTDTAKQYDEDCMKELKVLEEKFEAFTTLLQEGHGEYYEPTIADLHEIESFPNPLSQNPCQIQALEDEAIEKLAAASTQHWTSNTDYDAEFIALQTRCSRTEAECITLQTNNKDLENALQEEHAQYHHDETAYGAELAETQTNPAVAKGELAEANVELEQVCEIVKNAQNLKDEFDSLAYLQKVQNETLEKVIQELQTLLTEERFENACLRDANKMLEYKTLSQGIEIFILNDQLLCMKSIIAQIYILNKRTKYGTFQVPASTRSNNVRAVILPITIPPPKPVLGYLSPARAKPTDQKPAEIPVCNTTRLRQFAWFPFYAAVLTAVILFKTQLCGIAECFFFAAVVLIMFGCELIRLAFNTMWIIVWELVQIKWWLQGISPSGEC